MTRETKVGLLAGMALILLVGILVSDHLSVGQPQPTGELIEFAGGIQDSINANDAVPAPSMRGFNHDRRPADPQPRRELRMPEEIVAPETQTEPQRVAAARTQEPAVEVETFTIAPPAEPVAVADATPAPAVRAITNEPTVLEAVRRESFIPARVLVPVSKPVRRHTAQEPLYKIAEKYYNDGNRWPIIQKANKDKVGPQGQVRAGVSLIIPYIEEASPVDAIAEQAAPTPPAATANAVPQRIIRVESGATLSGLAHKYLGNANRWEALLDANKDQLKRPEDLQPGMELKLPTDAPATADATANRPAAIAPREAATTTTSNAKTYTVVSGDSLSAIAKKHLGNESAWYQLYEANRDVMSSADDLSVGVTLKIPAKQ